MLQLVATILCSYLGWQRVGFMRWPLSIIVCAAVAGLSLVIAYHHPGAGPDLDVKLMNATLSLIALPLLAYWLAWLVRSALNRR